MPASFSGSYTQNFDGLATSGTGNVWTNDVTLPGWSLFRQSAASPVAVTTYNADTGASNSGAFVSYGSAASSERALGGLGTGGVYFGSPSSGGLAGWMALALTNASGSPISSLTLSYNGEQWRNGGNATAQSMVLQYGYGPSFEQVTSWIAPGGNFDWSSPVTSTAAAAVDGNIAGRAAARGGSLDLSATPWAAEATLWLRWIETNDVGNDHGLAIDDLTITGPQPPAQPEVAILATDASAAEFGDGASVRVTRSGPTDAALEVALGVVAGDGLATAADLGTAIPASVTIPAGASSLDLPIAAFDDLLDEGKETLRLQISAPSGYTLASGAGSAEITIVDNDRISLISAVQGSGASTPLASQIVTLRAVVVGDFQLSGELGGFFLQEESADWDGSALTSEGLYVTYPLSGANVDVVLGDRVVLTGTVSERFGQTAMTSVAALTVEAQGRLADTRRIDIPDLLSQRSGSGDLEPFEGMWVRFPETLSVNGIYGQFRYGEVELSAGGLPLQPTNVMEPGPVAYAAEQANALRELVLDDGSNSGYRPAAAATPSAPVRDQLLRRGDTITAVEGVLAYDFSKYRLHPTSPLAFSSDNPRPAAPAAPAAGHLRLASYNVLNTFTTLNAGGALTDSGLAPRGANTDVELERQLSKLTAALAGLQADVIGLMELENDADDATLAAIVQRLNAAQPTGSGRVYSFIPTGLIGTDAIKVGLIYNNLAVAPSGSAQVLSTVAFTDPLASGTPKNRPALAQAFRQLAGGELVNVVVNHLKSKGADGATGLDLDQKDGQSAFNATRTAAAGALLRWIDTNPTGNSDRDWVILGDLNAYAQEDPIQTLAQAGYRNVLPTFTAEPPNSYAFYNPVDMSGALDHMLISPSLVSQVVAARDWGINAAEGAFRDYNLDTNSNGNAPVRDFFAADPYRTSDHDPLLLDLQLGRPAPGELAFAHGVASGDPYADSVILWTRITPPESFKGLIDVSWELARSPGFESGTLIDSGLLTTSSERDWTIKVEADGLQPDTTYFYRFRSGSHTSAVGQTKTTPTGAVDSVRLAVFSCANYTADEAFVAYGRAAAIDAVNPYDALLVLGDYIYEYGPGGYPAAESAAAERGFLPNREIISLDDYRQRYALYHTDRNLQALRAAAPLIAIWDDHEVANDSWSGGAENHQSATEGDWISRRDAALKAYYEWLPIREPGQRQLSDGVNALSPLSQAYRSFTFGDLLALHVLETRLTARDQQLNYPDAAAVQTRIGAILADPSQVLAYATRLGLTPPDSAAAVPAFAMALAPVVTQELVVATVQQAWGDPSRDLLGDTQLAWLLQQMAGSNAAWQLLGQQVLMQSMAVPAALLLNPGDPALLDNYAAPLQKLATGTPFADLPVAEQALFAEAGKIPYNLEAWDGYGVERETILQTAQALGKRLISLAGDTHNAWAGVLETITAGAKPAGTVAGLEFGIPGVTSPGFEKYLPGADAYIRARYPAVDGLDGLFRGYVSGLGYADLNRRGYLDLTVTPQSVEASFELLDSVDPLTGQSVWARETVMGSSNLALSTLPEVSAVLDWQPGWQQLDLVMGLVVDASGTLVPLDPRAYGAVPERGVQLPAVRVIGSDDGDHISVGADSRIESGDGADQLFNTDSLGGNVLIAGQGTDALYLQVQVPDQVIGGELFGTLPLADGTSDRFFLDSGSADPAAGADASLQILDLETAHDRLYLDGQLLDQSNWPALQTALSSLGVSINAVPILKPMLQDLVLAVLPQTPLSIALTQEGTDLDGDPLELILLSGPEWIKTEANRLILEPPVTITTDQLQSTDVWLALSDGQAATPFVVQLSMATPGGLAVTVPTAAELRENLPYLAPAPVTSGALGTVKWTLAGDDAALFSVDADGVVSMQPRDFEAPSDQQADNTYRYTLIATDSAGGNASQSVVVTVTDATESVDLSIGRVADASVSENAPFASEAPELLGAIQPVSWVLEGDDKDQFTVDANGVVRMVSRNFEAPVDLDRNNTYQLTLRATDADGNTAVKAFVVSVTDAIEPATLTIAGISDRTINENVAYSSAVPLLTGGPIGAVTWTLEGVDKDRFGVDTNGVVRMLARNFEAPLDSDGNNTYQVTLRATDADGNTAIKALVVSVTDAIEPATLAITGVTDRPVAENTAFSSATPQVTGGPIGVLTWTLEGVDKDRFSVDASGVVRMVARNYEAPVDSDGNNTYQLQLRATDADGNTAVKPLLVTVTDAIESATLSVSGLGPAVVFESQPFRATAVPSGNPIGSITWSLEGPDKGLFSIDASGVVQMQARDYEGPQDANRDNVYELNVRLTDSDQNTVVQPLSLTVRSLNQAVLPKVGSTPVLDFTAISSADAVQGQLNWSRRPGERATFGFYRSLDAKGTVRSADGSATFKPGDSGYETAALHQDNLITTLPPVRVQDGLTGQRSLDINEAGFVVPYATLYTTVVDAVIQPSLPRLSPLVSQSTLFPSAPIPPLPAATAAGGRVVVSTVFAFEQANAGNSVHIKMLEDGSGSLLIGLESSSQVAQADFRDVSMALNFSALV